MIGTQFDSYQILALLGEGGFSKVYRAYDHRSRRYVALKVFRPDLLNSHKNRERFHREVEAARRLQHRYIVPVYKAGFVGRRAYISMKLMERTLASLMERYSGRGMEAKTTARLLRQMASALEHAHSKGVLHRDIKPHNVLLDADGRAYLSDFGMAKVKGMITITNKDDVIGSIHYMAPEQVRGLYQMSKESDVYSLGVVLYQMVTGYVPFQEASTNAVLSAIMSKPVPPPRSINPRVSLAVERVIVKALAKEPKRRYASPHALSNAYSNVAIARAPKPPPPEQGAVKVRQKGHIPPTPPATTQLSQQFWMSIGTVAFILFFLMLLGR